MSSIGRKRWAIAEGYIPDGSHGPEPQRESHETFCVLNAGDSDAHLRVTIFFAARRTKHFRFNQLTDPEPIPKAIDYASLIESDMPVVVQHTRLDNRRALKSSRMEFADNPHPDVHGEAL